MESFKDYILGFNNNVDDAGLNAAYNWTHTRERLGSEFNDKIKRYSKVKKFDFIKEHQGFRLFDYERS